MFYFHKFAVKKLTITLLMMTILLLSGSIVAGNHLRLVNAQGVSPSSCNCHFHSRAVSPQGNNTGGNTTINSFATTKLRYLVTLKENVTKDPLSLNNSITLLNNQTNLLGGKLVAVYRTIGVLAIDSPQRDAEKLISCLKVEKSVASVEQDRPVHVSQNALIY